MTPMADVNEAAALVGDYMAGRLADPPWQAFGLSRAPLICGETLIPHERLLCSRIPVCTKVICMAGRADACAGARRH